MQQKPVDVGLTLAKEITARTSLAVLVLGRGTKTLRASPAAGITRLPLFTKIPRLSGRP